MRQVAARVFLAKDFAKALEYKEMVGGIMVRTYNDNMPGYVIYEVWHLPLSDEQEEMLHEK